MAYYSILTVCIVSVYHIVTHASKNVKCHPPTFTRLLSYLVHTTPLYHLLFTFFFIPIQPMHETNIPGTQVFHFSQFESCLLTDYFNSISP